MSGVGTGVPIVLMIETGSVNRRIAATLLRRVGVTDSADGGDYEKNYQFIIGCCDALCIVDCMRKQAELYGRF